MKRLLLFGWRKRYRRKRCPNMANTRRITIFGSKKHSGQAWQTDWNEDMFIQKTSENTNERIWMITKISYKSLQWIRPVIFSFPIYPHTCISWAGKTVTLCMYWCLSLWVALRLPLSDCLSLIHSQTAYVEDDRRDKEVSRVSWVAGGLLPDSLPSCRTILYHL